YAEELYQKLKIAGGPESVHLADWPQKKWQFASAKILNNMLEVRRIVSLGLEARSKANIKIRQPLKELRIKNYELREEYSNLIKDEINVKQVILDKDLKEEIYLDTNLTPELEEEGRVREIIRSIQEMRKEKGLMPGDEMELRVPEAEREFYMKHQKAISSATNSSFLTE
ncbi:MAG: DUF5915 domain-containing protein, partial [Patescibacteria group bacterium]